jgi:predicted proteasome-type protease
MITSTTLYEHYSILSTRLGMPIIPRNFTFQSTLADTPIISINSTFQSTLTGMPIRPVNIEIPDGLDPEELLK